MFVTSIDLNSAVTVVAIGLAVWYLRQYLGAKAKNLAQKEDLKELTKTVERVRDQFERANVVHRAQFETEFKACRVVWSAACRTHKEFCRLHPVENWPVDEDQGKKFNEAQQKFADVVDDYRPFMDEAIWKAFNEFEDEVILSKGTPIPKDEVREVRSNVRIALERCAKLIKERFAQLQIV